MSYRGIKLSPSVICMDWFNLEQQFDQLIAEGIDYLHFDVADSYFVPELMLPFYLIKKIIKRVDIRPEYHLMVEEPKRIFELIPNDVPSSVGIHYEACRNLHRDLVSLRRMGFSPFLVINPATTLEHIEYVIEEVSAVVVMTVNPGSPSQKAIPQTLKKIEKLRQWRDKAGFDLEIIVDGNVSYENIPKMIRCGAESLVLGTSSIFSPELSGLQEGFEKLRSAIDDGLGVSTSQKSNVYQSNEPISAKV